MSDEPVETDEDEPQGYRPTRGVLSQQDYQGAQETSEDE